MTARTQAHALRAESHRLRAQAARLEDAADRLDPMGLRYEPPEDDRSEYHERMAAYWRARAAGMNCEQAEDEAAKLSSGSCSGMPVQADPADGAALGGAAPGTQE